VSESALYKDLSICATSLNHRLWRNEIGTAVYRNPSGDIYHVPYGIPGPGGSDMLGYTLRTITQDDVGKMLPIFTGIEGKAGRKKARANQQTFLDAITRVGGYAGVARTIDDYRYIVGAK